MSIRPCLVKCEIRPGLAPCSMTAVGPLVFHFASHPAHVHVPPVERLLRRVLFGPAAYGSHSSVDVLMYSTPWSWHHCRISQASMFQARSIRRSPAPTYFAEQRAHVFLGHAVAHEAHALRGPLLQLGRAVLEIHHRDVLRRHLEVLEENRQRALGNGAVADEEDFVFECESWSELG